MWSCRVGLLQLFLAKGKKNTSLCSYLPQHFSFDTRRGLRSPPPWRGYQSFLVPREVCRRIEGLVPVCIIQSPRAPAAIDDIRLKMILFSWVRKFCPSCVREKSDSEMRRSPFVAAPSESVPSRVVSLLATMQRDSRLSCDNTFKILVAKCIRRIFLASQMANRNNSQQLLP